MISIPEYQYLLAIMANQDIDDLWRTTERSVRDGDFRSYASLYHTDAVVIENEATQLARDALDGWRAGFDATATGEQSVSLSFRFSKRLHGLSSAQESGIFRYTIQKRDETEEKISYIFFESVVVKKDGRWVFLTEDQKGAASRDQWDALPDA